MEGLEWMDGPQDVAERCAALGAELAYLRGTTVEVSIDDDGVYELPGDVFASRNLADICSRLEELIAREEGKSKKVLGLSNWVRLPKVRGKGNSKPVKEVPKPPVMRSAQVALSMSMPAIVAMFTVGSTWKITDTSNSTHCSTWRVTKAMPKTMILLNEYGEWRFTYPSEVVIIDARLGYLSFNISNGETITMKKQEA